ncbi:MAG: DMT family transporter [Vulcanimicrobiaceae bacterium]
MVARAHGPIGIAIAIGYIFLWASAYVPSKVAAIQSTPLWFLVARFTTAGAIMAIVALAFRQRFPSTRRGWFVACALGVFSNALYLGLTYTALHHLSSGMGAIVASTNPLILALIAPKLLGERLTPLKGVGLALGFGGVVAIVFARSGTGSAAPGDVALAFLGVCSSVASTLVYKRFGTGESLVAINAVQLVAAGLVLVPVAALVGAPHATMSPELVGSFTYLVLVLSVGASLMWFWLLTHGEASRVSAFYYLTPAFGLALSAVLLHESVRPSDLVGLAAIAGGIALVQRT